MTRPNQAQVHSVQRQSSVFVAGRDMHAFKREWNGDRDGAHLTSFGIEFQTEEEAKENKRSSSVATLCAGLLKRGMVNERERVLRVSNDFISSMSVTYDGAVQLWQW